MAHFAIVNKETNVVKSVVVVSNATVFSDTGIENENEGIVFLSKLYNNPTDVYFRQTSYNGSFRKNFAGIGYAFDEKLDGFIAPQPIHPQLVPDPNDNKNMIPDTGEWVLNESTCRWEWVSASSATQSMFRRAANAIIELPSKIVNIVTPKQENMTEKYTGSYFKFIFKDSKNWIVLLASLILFLIPLVTTNGALPSYFFIAVWLVVLIGTIMHYRERKQGKTS